MGNKRAGKRVGADHVNVEHIGKVLDGHFFNRLFAVIARIVAQDGHIAALPYDLSGDFLRAVGIGHIAGITARAAAQLLASLLQLFGVSGQKNHLSPGGCHTFRHREPKAGRAAGNDGALPLQRKHVFHFFAHCPIFLSL